MTEFKEVLGDLEPWVRSYGAPAIFVILTLESLGAPLPGESLLIVAAVLAGRGDLSIGRLFLAAWSGAVVGDNIGYLIGRMGGHRLLARYGGKIGLSVDRIQKTEDAFARYGPVIVVLARFVNVLRQLNGIVAGALGMDWRIFLLLNTTGGALWVLVWSAVGVYLGSHGADVAALVGKIGFFGLVVASVALLAVGIYVVRHWLVARWKQVK